MGFKSGKTGDGQEKEHVFDEFIEDIENDIRLEKYEQIWKKHGKLISTAGTVFIGGCVLFGLWYKHNEDRREEVALQFIKAQNVAENGKLEEALSMMTFLASQNVGKYPILAKFSRAGLLVKDDFDKNIAEIKAIYKSIYSDSGCPAYFKHLAIVLYVNALLQERENLPEEQAKEALGLLRKCQNKNEDGLFLLAKELEGVILFLQKDFKEARAAFDTISRNKKTTEGMRKRIHIMIQAIQSQLNESTTQSVGDESADQGGSE
ncbi:MAG: tetratricopeptide repeat protein [Holosporales bacterium]|jgi:hypothetical protein|nr:tetratricopeptide repeat protein [Holosporales bacterium]